MKRKILVIHNGYPLRGDGGDKVRTLNMLQSLDSIGFDVCLLAFFKKDFSLLAFFKKDFSLLALNKKSVPSAHFHLSNQNLTPLSQVPHSTI